MSRRTTMIMLAALLGGAVAVGVLVPIPSPAAVRDWATAFGWATPVLFLLGYSLLAVAPIPRTVFNLSAGLLLGEALGVAVAMVASAIAATLAFTLTRRLGRRWMSPLLEHGAIQAVDTRLRTGGLAGVISLRLIPMIPFAPVNYCCGLSTIAYRQYLTGTLIGSLPGTAAAVILGDALTGTTPPALLIIYGTLAIAGGLGLYKTVKRTHPDLTNAHPTTQSLHPTKP